MVSLLFLFRSLFTKEEDQKSKLTIALRRFHHILDYFLFQLLRWYFWLKGRNRVVNTLTYIYVIAHNNPWIYFCYRNNSTYLTLIDLMSITGTRRGLREGTCLFPLWATSVGKKYKNIET